MARADRVASVSALALLLVHLLDRLHGPRLDYNLARVDSRKINSRHAAVLCDDRGHVLPHACTIGIRWAVLRSLLVPIAFNLRPNNSKIKRANSNQQLPEPTPTRCRRPSASSPSTFISSRASVKTLTFGRSVMDLGVGAVICWRAHHSKAASTPSNVNGAPPPSTAAHWSRPTFGRQGDKLS